MEPQPQDVIADWGFWRQRADRSQDSGSCYCIVLCSLTSYVSAITPPCTVHLCCKFSAFQTHIGSGSRLYSTSYSQ